MKFWPIGLLAALILVEMPIAGRAQAPASAGPSTAANRKPTAEQWLAQQGLRRLSTSYALAEEGDFGRLLKQLEDLEEEMEKARKKVAQLDQQEQERKRLLVQTIQQRRQLAMQLERGGSVRDQNRMVTMYNELGDRITLLQTASQDDTAYQAARAEVGKLSEQYVEMLLNARTLHKQIIEKYQQVDADRFVHRAIDSYNKANGRNYTLGPTATFRAGERKLAKLETAVLSEEIALRRGRSDLWYVSVTLNGEHVHEMAIDTGASIVVMPHAMAAKSGLAPTEDAPVLTMTLADGSQISARKVVADRVRVGKFTATNVECAVLPENLPPSEALLGQSFLRNFIYKIDSASGKLVMTEIGGGEEPPASPPRRK